jgi:ABC-2 type transport system ATP-binding protein
MISVEKLSKSYGDLQAVAGVSFEVRDGEIYGLLGPNGAGKTTTISMLCGLLRPDEGKMTFGGIDLATDPIAVKRKLGVVPQDVALYDELTARENLKFWAGLYGLEGKALHMAIDEVLDQVGLSPRADSKVKEFSGGMKRRLNLGLGLVHKPEVVMMDEPTVGIDPQARINILDVVRNIVASGTTVLYTTHYLEEAETLCDRIGIMDHGKLLAEGTLDELKQLLGEGEMVTVRGKFEPDQAVAALDGIAGVKLLKAEEHRLLLSTEADGASAVRLLSRVLDGELAVEGVSIQPPSLNGLFLKLTGRELRD